MNEIPAAITAGVKEEVQYDCWACHWRPSGEAFCGTCIQKILDAIQAEKSRGE